MAEESRTAALGGGGPRAPGSRFAVLLLITAGAAGFFYLWLHPRSVSPHITETRERTVRVFPASRVRRRLTVTAYGTSRASRRWTAIAEVGGSVVAMHPSFEPGEVLPEGALVAQIDPTEYEQAVSLGEAEVRAKREELNELDQHEANLKEIAKLQERLVRYALDERDRLGKLLAENASSRSQVEETECAYVGELANLQMIRNELDLIPARRRVLQACLDVAAARLAGERLRLAKCSVRLPFAARCASKQVDLRQCVGVGDRLGEFQSLDQAEVVVMLEMQKLLSLFPEGIQPSGLETIRRLDPNEALWRRTKVPAEVQWELESRPRVWRGRLARLEGAFDPATRMIPAIIEVPDPVQEVRPGIPQSLLPGAFCRVTLYGAAVSDVVVIPRGCVQETLAADVRWAEEGDGACEGGAGDASRVEHFVYLLRTTSNASRRGRSSRSGEMLLQGALHRARVVILAMEDNCAVIDQGIEEGDLVIRSDLAEIFPASEGMPLQGFLEENPIGPQEGFDPSDDYLTDAAQEPARSEAAGAFGQGPLLEAAGPRKGSLE